MFYAFKNPIDITPSGTSGWQTVTVPYDETSQNGVPAHANGIVVYAVTSGGAGAGARAVGNTDDKRVSTYYKGYFACAINSNRQCQLYRDSIDLTVYKLVGYFYGDDFVELATMVDKTPSTTGAWVTVDVSANVPAGAKAALVMVRNASGSSYEGSVRPKTSTLGTTGAISISYGYMALVTLDNNRQFEAYIENTVVKIYLVGYVKQGTWYFNPESRDKRPGTTGSWQTVTLSDMTSGGAAVFLNRVSVETTYGFRKPTSSDTNTSNLYTYQRQTMSVVGTDANKNVEIYAGGTSIAMLLMGWFESLPGITPTAIEAFATSRSSFQISWTPVIKSEGATGYAVQRDTNSSFPNPTTVNVNDPNATSYEFTGLLKNTRYFARVMAKNEYGNGPWSNVVNTYTFAVQKFTTANPIKDAQGNTLTNVVVVTLRQSILNAISASANGAWLDLNKQVRVNKIDTYPKEIEVPGGTSSDKLVTFWYKSGILGEVQPDIDPTTGA